MGRRPKKKTKKQLEDELLAAANDQKRLEEQERLLKLEEDFLAAHKARLASELDAKQRVEEAERLGEENVIVAAMKGERAQSLEFENRKLRDQIEWQKFISCTSRPNVAFENEITTYMTMVQDEPVHQIADARTKCNESEEIVGDLMELYCKAREEGDIARQEWCMHYIHEIRALELEKIDEATAYLLQFIEKEANANAQVTLAWGEAHDDIKVGFWGHLQSKGFRAKQIEHHKIQISLDLPKSIAMQSMGHCIGVRTLYTAYDSVRGKDPSQMSVGGMIRVDLLSIPPFSKRVKGWTIRQIPPPDQELQRLPYPNTEHATASTAIAAAPCKIEYKVPSHVILAKSSQASPTISWWDTAAEKWSTEGISDICWVPEVRTIAFFSQRLAAFSITQERHLDLPYQWWSMRPVEPLAVELTIQAARYELHFIISESGLRLKGPDLPELHNFMYENTGDPDAPVMTGLGSNAGKTPRVRSPATLLCELRTCGLSLLPEDGDAEFLDGYTPKCSETEARAYSDLSELAATFDIASSIHNKSLPKDQALVRIRENLLFEHFDPLDPDCDSDYQAVKFFADKACFVQSLEGVSPCREALLPDHVTHASLYLDFERRPDPGPTHDEQLARLQVDCGNVRFIEAVRQTMALMRLLSFV